MRYNENHDLWEHALQLSLKPEDYEYNEEEKKLVEQIYNTFFGSNTRNYRLVSDEDYDMMLEEALNMNYLILSKFLEDHDLTVSSMSREYGIARSNISNIRVKAHLPSDNMIDTLEEIGLKLVGRKELHKMIKEGIESGWLKPL